MQAWYNDNWQSACDVHVEIKFVFHTFVTYIADIQSDQEVKTYINQFWLSNDL